ncbi:hypothetical protein OS493_003599 [Desmophyllum pertusum]|uniref:Alpha-mannosidase n=1 Tax=Desmophyllum pertusum TaxID=174260 RepID=A0A9X0DBJ6_9CNID|nr:hypothetical protein OS493_003599 [Desmophyllum pertusum]
MKKWMVLLGGAMFCVLFFSMYLVVDQLGRLPTSQEIFKVEMKQKIEDPLNVLDKDMNKLEGNIQRSGKIMSSMQNTVEKLRFHGHRPATEKQENVALVRRPEMQSSDMDDGCMFSGTASGKSANVKMLDMFDVMPFDNVDGGSWKQGWDVRYDDNAFDKEPLNVFVVPHSHNDPGWVKTLDQYYTQQTRHILDNVIDALAEDKRRKFIWAEISYLSMWWKDTDDQRKKLALEQLSSGQLEIVTGGWVMNDEANTHYYAMLDQMIEGHQWIEKNLGSGEEASCQGKNLEFMWRQNWDHGSSTDMFCHMMPFYSYDVPHTCGPEPKICCQFDFRRLPGGGINCPWRIPPVRIDDSNVGSRANLLLDQYKKKAQLYRTNVLFVPLGDDFRYETKFEAHEQYTNYQRLMDHINSHPELKAKIQFGTLSDYFNAIWKTTGSEPGSQPKGFPALSGDFYTYADRDDHYWSGYYTSRPFYKHMDRALESHHRAAEIIFSLAESHARHHASSTFAVEQLYGLLTNARRNLGVFQHHDGITGTAKDFVVIDYATRMLQSLNDMQRVIQDSAHFLLTTDKSHHLAPDPVLPPLKFGESRLAQDALPTKDVLTLSNTPRPVVLYNSLTTAREQVVSLHISEPKVMVSDSEGKEVPSQVNLWWDHRNRISTAKYESECSSITEYNAAGESLKLSEEFKHEVKQPGAEFIILENDHLKVEFDSLRGLLKSITHKKDGAVTQVAIDFVSYGTKASGDRSGAYLFMPNGPAEAHGIGEQPSVYVSRGKLMQEVRVALPNVLHVVRIYSVSGPEGRTLDIQNKVDIRNQINRELVMRIKSNVQNSGREFYTDLNGFQMQKRKTLDKIPIQANFYPLPSMAFLQDKSTRDDNRGLGQGVTDNKVTAANFRLVVERFKSPHEPDGIPLAYPSLLSHRLLHHLNHPLFTFVTPVESADSVNLLSNFNSLQSDLPNDIFMVTLRSVADKQRPRPSGEALLVLHRLGYDCNFECKCLATTSRGQVKLNHLFKDLSIDKLQSTSLTMLHEYQELDPSSPLNVDPMELYSYKMRLK